ncbi:RNase adapter RapZ [Roseobacter sp. HKCCA0434]|uniref:RNase adapter RapZ n=1 Tax=Roseobacter sp. HKCCA0434 TaxID=3079297 RepID=UPI002905BF41|nr:RNase adapter RapZ [Roseobacter sp. HKCCA0434]
MTAVANRNPIVIVTGPSGAGRTTAIRALQDLRYETIDNLPLSLIRQVAQGGAATGPLAIGVDVRTRGFSASNMIWLTEWMQTEPDIAGRLLYLDCAPDVLLRRFSETRRRHPLEAEAPAVAIEQEIDLLRGLRDRADVVIDTTDLTPHDLKAEIARWFGPQGQDGLSVSVQSFSYKRGVPQGLDMVLDCRFLQNPHWVPELRDLTGLNEAVAAHVAADPRHDAFIERVNDLLELLIPAYRDEGKSYFSLGFGCTGGQHRSVYMAETLGKRLAEDGARVSIRHRELTRRGLGLRDGKREVAPD